MSEHSTTTSAKRLGDCHRCGWPVWEGCTHFCSTGPNWKVQMTYPAPTPEKPQQESDLSKSA